MKLIGKIRGNVSSLPEWVAKIDEEIKGGDDSVRALPYPVYGSRMPDAGFALVQCHYGHDDRRVAATKKAIGVMSKSNPRPQEWIFIEAQSDGKYELEDVCAESGITFRGIELGKDSDYIFVKEALWNIGARESNSDYLVFIDADCVMCNPSWATHVEKCLETYDFGSPHGFSYYGLNGDDRDETTDKVQMSSGYATMMGKGHGHPGFGVFMTRSLFDHLGGLPVTSSAGADSWLWYRIIGHWRRPYTLFRLPYNAPYLWNYGLKPFPRIGSTNELLCHIGHGPRVDRHYQAQALLARWSTTMPYEDITDDAIPKWSDTQSGRIHSKARAELLSMDSGKSDEESIRLARECFDRAAAEEYGEIDDGHPLVVSTALRSGDRYTPDHVLMLRDLFKRHLKTPHDFVCISDVDIPGVHTVPFESSATDTPYFYSQIELYREIYPKGASVLTCDLDCIPIADFTMHRCPEGTFWMGWEQHNWPQSNRCIWNGGLTYFSGNFDFIFNDFMCGNGREQMKSLFSFISSQEFIQGSLFRHGITIQDILRHICFEFYHGYGKLDVPCSTMVHFLGCEKPWDIQERPDWLPMIAWRPLERRAYR